MSFFLSLTRARAQTYDITVTASDGSTVFISPQDIVKLRIGRTPVTVLEISSGAALAGGSTITASNPVRLSLRSSDLNLSKGIYDAELFVLDYSEGLVPKHIEKGIAHVRGNPSGTIDPESSLSSSSNSTSETSSRSSSSVSSSSESSVSSSSVSSVSSQSSQTASSLSSLSSSSVSSSQSVSSSSASTTASSQSSSVSSLSSSSTSSVSSSSPSSVSSASSGSSSSSSSVSSSSTSSLSSGSSLSSLSSPSSLSSSSSSPSSVSSSSQSESSSSSLSSSLSGSTSAQLLAMTIGPSYQAEPVILEPSDPVNEITFTDNFLPDLNARLQIPAAVADLMTGYNSGRFIPRVIYAIAYNTGLQAIRDEWIAKSADFANADWDYVDIVDSDDRERWAQFLTFCWIPWGVQFEQAFEYVKAWIDTKTASIEQDDIRKYWDNDVHGRTYHILETFLVMKTLANNAADLWAIPRLQKLGVFGADELYSPYKICGMLNGFAQDTSGIQMTGKHYDAGLGDGYERMWTTNPWMLMNLWKHSTGTDLLSQCTFFTKLGESIFYRHKNYWRNSPLARRGWYYANQCCDSLGEWAIQDTRPTYPVHHNPEIDFLYRDYSRAAALPSTLTSQCFNLSHRRGDGIISYREDLDDKDTYMVDISWAGRGGQRSEFDPRLIGFTIANKGLPFVHRFKGAATWRSTTGVSFAPWPMTSLATYQSYETEADRPLSQSDQSSNPVHTYPQPTFNDLASYVSFTDDWSFRITDATKAPLGEPSASIVSEYRLWKTKRQLDILDAFTFTTARPCVYSFTLSGLPTFLDANSFEIQGANIIVEIIGGTWAWTTLTDIWTGNRDTWPDNAVYDPYDLDVIVCQVYATSPDATSHSYTVRIYEKVA